MSAIHTPEGAREVFHAYVGGVYTQDNGSMAVNAWAYNLIVPPESRPKEEENIYPPPPSVPYPMAPPPPPLPPPSVPYHSRGRTSSMSSGRKVPVLADDANGYADGYNTTSPNKVAYLPRFNEFCTQRRVSVQYNAEQGGLQHAPRWIVKCMGEPYHSLDCDRMPQMTFSEWGTTGRGYCHNKATRQRRGRQTGVDGNGACYL